MFKIANSKLSEEVVVVFLSELVVPGCVAGLGVVFVLAQELVRSPENIEFCGGGGG